MLFNELHLLWKSYLVDRFIAHQARQDSPRFDFMESSLHCVILCEEHKMLLFSANFIFICSFLSIADESGSSVFDKVRKS